MSASTLSGRNEPRSEPTEKRRAPETTSTKGTHAGEGTSLLDVLVIVVRHRRVVGLTTVLFLSLGIVYLLVVPDTYVSSARLTLEAQDEQMQLSGGLSALRGFGLGLGLGSGPGLAPEAYPSLFESREVVLTVARDTFYFSDLDSAMTYTAYVGRPGGVFARAIKALKRSLKTFIVGDEATAPVASLPAGVPKPLSPEEETAVTSLRQAIQASYDMQTGLISVSIAATDPIRAAHMLNSAVDGLSERVIAVRTKKTRNNLVFTQQRFERAQQELWDAEAALAQFLDRNRNLESARLGVEQDRLQRRVNFKRELYSEMQTQVAQAELELQRSQPVVTVIEEPAPPGRPSAPSTPLVIVLCLVLGMGTGVGIAFVLAFVEDQREGESRRQFDEVRSALAPVLARFRHLRMPWARRSDHEKASEPAPRRERRNANGATEASPK
jgi:uncharacterized protein involved in exopolysaccharide biosynthesis